MTGAINTQEGVRLAARGLHRCQPVEAIKALKAKLGTAECARRLDSGESTVYNAISGAGAISETMLERLYGASGKLLLERHRRVIDGEEDAAPPSRPVAPGASVVPAAPKAASEPPPVALERAAAEVAALPQREAAPVTDLAEIVERAAKRDKPRLEAASPADWRTPALAAIGVQLDRAVGQRVAAIAERERQSKIADDLTPEIEKLSAAQAVIESLAA